MLHMQSAAGGASRFPRGFVLVRRVILAKHFAKRQKESDDYEYFIIGISSPFSRTFDDKSI